MATITLRRKSQDLILLEKIARDELERARSPNAALASFVEEIRDSRGLALALLDEADLEARALSFLAKVAWQGSAPE